MTVLRARQGGAAVPLGREGDVLPEHVALAAALLRDILGALCASPRLEPSDGAAERRSAPGRRPRVRGRRCRWGMCATLRAAARPIPPTCRMLSLLLSLLEAPPPRNVSHSVGSKAADEMQARHLVTLRQAALGTIACLDLRVSTIEDALDADAAAEAEAERHVAAMEELRQRQWSDDEVASVAKLQAQRRGQVGRRRAGTARQQRREADGAAGAAGAAPAPSVSILRPTSPGSARKSPAAARPPPEGNSRRVALPPVGAAATAAAAAAASHRHWVVAEEEADEAGAESAEPRGLARMRQEVRLVSNGVNPV